MNNFELPTETKTPTSYTEMKLKVLITDIIKKLDKNQQDYWVIRTELDQFTKRSYLAFSGDYGLDPKAAYWLMNPHKIINQFVLLTIRKKDDKQKVINLELDK